MGFITTDKRNSMLTRMMAVTQNGVDEKVYRKKDYSPSALVIDEVNE